MTTTGIARQFAFPRACRLQGRHAYAIVFAYKCSVAGVFFQVYARPNGLPRARLGLTVSKRVVRRATARNFCKRLAREAFRAHHLELAGVDLVVRFRAPVVNATIAQARAEMIALMRHMCCSPWRKPYAKRP